MKYDFDTVVNRRNTDSLKWNVAAVRMGTIAEGMTIRDLAT